MSDAEGWVFTFSFKVWSYNAGLFAACFLLVTILSQHWNLETHRSISWWCKRKGLMKATVVRGPRGSVVIQSSQVWMEHPRIQGITTRTNPFMVMKFTVAICNEIISCINLSSCLLLRVCSDEKPCFFYRSHWGSGVVVMHIDQIQTRSEQQQKMKNKRDTQLLVEDKLTSLMKKIALFTFATARVWVVRHVLDLNFHLLWPCFAEMIHLLSARGRWTYLPPCKRSWKRLWYTTDSPGASESAPKRSTSKGSLLQLLPPPSGRASKRSDIVGPEWARQSSVKCFANINVQWWQQCSLYRIKSED